MQQKRWLIKTKWVSRKYPDWSREKERWETQKKAQVRVPNGTATLENTLAIAYEIKHSLSTCPTNLTPRYLPRSNEHVSPHKALSTRVHSSFLLFSYRLILSQSTQSKGHSVVRGQAPCGASTQGNTQQLKGVNYWCTQQLGWISKAFCSVREVRHKKNPWNSNSHVEYSILYAILEEVKLGRQKSGQWLPGVSEAMVWNQWQRDRRQLFGVQASSLWRWLLNCVYLSKVVELYCVSNKGLLYINY